MVVIGGKGQTDEKLWWHMDVIGVRAEYVTNYMWKL